jgi:hypothetical protein
MTPAPRVEPSKPHWLVEIAVLLLIAVSVFVAKETVAQGRDIAAVQVVQENATRERDALKRQLERIEDKLDRALAPAARP